MGGNSSSKEKVSFKSDYENLRDNPRFRIEHKKLILTEGKDAEIFWKWYCYKVLNRANEIQIIDFGGIRDLRQFLEALVLMSEFEEVQSLLIIQDAEQDAMSQSRVIASALKHVGLPVPEAPFAYSREADPKIAYLLLPGPDEEKGTLEDLCLKTVAAQPLLSCVDAYLSCAKKTGELFRSPHKNKLYSYLSGTSEYAGLKLGEAANRGAWDSNSKAIKPFGEIIMRM